MNLRPLRLLATAGVAAAALTTALTVPASATTSTDVSVFAWNVDLATASVDGADNLQAARRTPIVSSIIRQHGADVVVLDELFNLKSTTDLVNGLADVYPYHTPVVGETCSGGGWTGISGNCSNSPFVINGGTLIFSKYPITAQYAHIFTNSTYGTWDYNANKGADLAQIDKNGTKVWVVGTHLQADQSTVSTDSTQSTRLGQLGEIHSFVDGIVDPASPVLIGGDLNVEYYAGTTRGDYPNAQNALQGTLGTPATNPATTLRTMDCPVSAWCQYMSGKESFPVDYRDDLDYVGYLTGSGRPAPQSETPVDTLFDPQPGWAPGQTDTNAPSDHYPVQASFTL